ncbi:MAG: GntR family transcriptional regulator [Pseudomonadota bacterium]
MRTTLPLYRQVADILYERIRTGVYPLGEDLPTEVQLVAELKSSNHTVRHALRLLTERGLVVRRAGSGSRVIATQEHTVFSHSVGNLQQLLRYPPSTFREVLESEHIVADQATALLLRCDVGTPWFRIQYLRWAESGGKPICWTDVYLAPRYAGVIKLPHHGSIPVYDQLEQAYGERVERAQADIEARRVTPRQAQALQVPEETAAMVVTRRYSNSQGSVFEITVSTHPEGRFVYSLDFRREVKRR